jgi:hypothetical protein
MEDTEEGLPSDDEDEEPGPEGENPSSEPEAMEVHEWVA